MKLFNFVFYKLPAIAYIALTFYLSSLSRPPVPPNVSDVILHLIEFTLMYVVVYRAFNNGLFAGLNKKYLILSMVLLMAYGILDEVHQSFVPERVFSIKDMVMDLAGIIVGTAIALVISRRYRS